MTQYASYNPAVAAPSPVTGWYDTGEFTYADLPAASNLLAVTSAQWLSHFANPSGWAVSNGALVAYAPPAPVLTLAQQASSASVAGLTIASSGPTLTLAATLFPTDSATQTKINTVVNGINTTGAFPNGATTYPMVDSSGTWHTFSIAQYKAVSVAILSYVASCDLIAAGNPLSAIALPASSVSLSV